MTSIAGSGASVNSDFRAAAKDATRQALEQLKGKPPRFGFVFASPSRDLGKTLGQVRGAVGAAAPDIEIIGCTTAGEITERGLVHDGVAVLLVASDDSACSSGFASGLRNDAQIVGDVLSRAADDLKKSKVAQDSKQMTTVVLVDGLAGTGEKLVTDLYERRQGGSRIVGGAAGDEGKFDATYVGSGVSAATDSAAALHVRSRMAWGIGVNHGLRSTTKQMRVTRAEGNVVFELDGEPALAPYVRHARERGVKLSAANAGPYMIGNELGIHFFDKINRVRAPLSAAEDGSLTCAAGIPKGSMVSILDGDPDKMIDAVRTAALEARQQLGDHPVAAVLLFDCVCRGMILKDGFGREIAAVRSVFGDAPIAGFLTYGEIARYGGKLDGWHNATAVVVAIPQ
jgi:methyl-accepting chemotaxis protein